MRLQISKAKRRGSHLVECAIVYPLTFLMILGTITGGIGIFNYQEMAFLAREAARYASTHAGQYAKENASAITAKTLPTVNQAYITSNLVNPKASLLKSSNLSVSIVFNSSNNPTGTTWDTALANGTNWPNTPVTISSTTYQETNTVSVTVSYTWYPLHFLGGPITLQSTSTVPVCY
jgi:Flp pilus assembly protein TadG